MPTPSPTESVFRDRRPGQEARRDHLLRKRRDDLAVLPHAMRRVFVGRVARLAAGVAGVVTGILLLGATASTDFYGWIGAFLPGPRPAVLATLLGTAWLATLLVYLLARSAAEHRFAVAMSKAVLPSANLDDDVERLHVETPGAVGARMARRVEMRANLWPLAAAGFVLPATFKYLELAIRHGGYPRNDALDAQLSQSSLTLLAIAVVAAIVAPVLARPERMHRALQATSVTLWLIASITACLAAANYSAALGVGVGFAAIALPRFFLARLNLRESDLLLAQDPHTGAETIDWRRLMTTPVRVGKAMALSAPKTARRAVSRVRLLPKWHRRGAIVALAGIPLALTTAFVASMQPTPTAPVSFAAPLLHTQPNEKTVDNSTVELVHHPLSNQPGFSGGTLLVDLELKGRSEVVLSAKSMSLPDIPRGWMLELRVENAGETSVELKHSPTGVFTSLAPLVGTANFLNVEAFGQQLHPQVPFVMRSRCHWRETRQPDEHLAVRALQGEAQVTSAALYIRPTMQPCAPEASLEETRFAQPPPAAPY